MKLPAELIDLIALYVEDSQFWDCRYTARPTQIYEVESRNALADFRLVSKVFCRSASPLLFREINATMTSRSNGKLQSAPLNKLLELSRGDYAQLVRVISVGVAGVVHGQDKATVASYIGDLGVILPACFSNYHRLNTLRVSGPCYPGGHKEDPHFPEDLRRALRNAIENTLGEFSASSLSELSLSLPLTHDFATLMDDTRCMGFTWPSPLQNVLTRLRHLDVSVDDNSGSGGQHWMLKPISGTQKAYPNEKFAPGFFKFIEAAKNVESLRIRATHVLDMDLLDATSFCELRTLELKNLKVTFENFLAIIDQNKATLRAIDLDGLQLKNGTWKALLIKLCSLPRLDYFSMDACSYSSDGSSAWLAPVVVPEMDTAIETRSILDYHSLGDLQRQVMYYRDIVGIPQMIDQDFKYARWKTLRDVEFPVSN